MSKSTTADQKANNPAFAVFIRVSAGGEKTRLEQVGKVWGNKNGTGFNIVLDEATDAKRLFILPFKR